MNPSLYLVDLRKRKGISQKDYDTLLRSQVITDSTHYICHSCLHTAKKQHGNDDDMIDRCLEKMQEMNEFVEVKRTRCLSGAKFNQFINIPKLFI